jgi:hypothetical protein
MKKIIFYLLLTFSLLSCREKEEVKPDIMELSNLSPQEKFIVELLKSRYNIAVKSIQPYEDFNDLILVNKDKIVYYGTVRSWIALTVPITGSSVTVYLYKPDTLQPVLQQHSLPVGSLETPIKNTTDQDCLFSKLVLDSSGGSVEVEFIGYKITY